MKVICIDAKPTNPKSWCQLNEGAVYEGELTNGHCGEPSYDLGHELLPTRCPCGCVNNSALYRASRFIPISTIDEMELLEQRQTQYA